MISWQILQAILIGIITVTTYTLTLFDDEANAHHQRQYHRDPDSLPHNQSYFDRQALRWGVFTGSLRNEKWVEFLGLTKQCYLDLCEISDQVPGHSSLKPFMAKLTSTAGAVTRLQGP